MDEVVDSPDPKSVRLIFEYEGDDVRLISQVPVALAVTGFELSEAAAAAHYLEVRNADEQPLLAVAVRDAMSASAEVFPEPGGEISRVDLPEARGAFTVVVPLAAGADHVALMRSPRAAAGASGVAALAEPQELGKFALETRGTPS